MRLFLTTVLITSILFTTTETTTNSSKFYLIPRRALRRPSLSKNMIDLLESKRDKRQFYLYQQNPMEANAAITPVVNYPVDAVVDNQYANSPQYILVQSKDLIPFQSQLARQNEVITENVLPLITPRGALSNLISLAAQSAMRTQQGLEVGGEFVNSFTVTTTSFLTTSTLTPNISGVNLNSVEVGARSVDTSFGVCGINFGSEGGGNNCGGSGSNNGGGSKCGGSDSNNGGSGSNNAGGSKCGGSEGNNGGSGSNNGGGSKCGGSEGNNGGSGSNNGGGSKCGGFEGNNLGGSSSGGSFGNNGGGVSCGGSGSNNGNGGENRGACAQSQVPHLPPPQPSYSQGEGGISPGISDALKTIHEEIKKVKAGKFNGRKEGLPCTLVGQWQSQAAGVSFIITKEDCHENCIGVEPGKTKGFFETTNWDVFAQMPFNKISLIQMIAVHQETLHMATFAGECRVCQGKELVSGHWLVVKNESSCWDMNKGQDFFGDLWERKVQNESCSN